MTTDRDPWRVVSVVGWILAFLVVCGVSAYTIAISIVEYIQSR